MKTERSNKTKRMLLISVAAVLVIAAITLLSVCLPMHKGTPAVTDQSTNNAPAERSNLLTNNLKAEFQQSFEKNASLLKLNELPDNLAGEEFAGGLPAFTDGDKAALLKNAEILDESGEKFPNNEDDVWGNDCEDGSCDFAERDDKYFADSGCGDCEIPFIENDENFFAENFGKACEDAELENDRIQELKREFDELLEARAELWEKVYASYDDLDENFDYANFDEVKYISELTVLTAEEKEVLLKDLARLNEISQKLYGICGANCGRW